MSTSKRSRNKQKGKIKNKMQADEVKKKIKQSLTPGCTSFQFICVARTKFIYMSKNINNKMFFSLDFLVILVETTRQFCGKM